MLSLMPFGDCLNHCHFLQTSILLLECNQLNRDSRSFQARTLPGKWTSTNISLSFFYTCQSLLRGLESRLLLAVWCQLCPCLSWRKCFRVKNANCSICTLYHFFLLFPQGLCLFSFLLALKYAHFLLILTEKKYFFKLQIVANSIPLYSL